MSSPQAAQSSAPRGNGRPPTNFKRNANEPAPSISSVFSRITGVPSEYSDWNQLDDIGPSISNTTSPVTNHHLHNDGGRELFNPFARRDSISSDIVPANMDISYAEDKFERLRHLYRERLDSLTTSLRNAVTNLPPETLQSTSSADDTTVSSPVFVPSKIEDMITAAKNKEREETIFRLQEELATKDAEFARWQRFVALLSIIVL